MRISLALLTLLIAAPVHAWQVSGQMLYEDRTFDLGGFNGTEELPIRLAVVEVVDVNAGLVLARGATDEQGFYRLDIVGNEPRNILVQAVSRLDPASGYLAEVVIEGDDQALTSLRYAMASPVLTVDGVTDLNISLLAESDNDLGKAFNILDNALHCLRFIETLTGTLPPTAWNLRLGWAIDSGRSGSFYRGSQRAIWMGDEAGYDDTIILHETGHFIHDYLSRSDSPGGSHSIGDSRQDARLSFSEGFATFWGSSVMAAAGYLRPDLYVNTNDYEDLSFSFEIEQLDRYSYTRGSASEARVMAAMWDIVDDEATSDGLPGSDDDPLALSHDTWLRLFQGPLASSSVPNTMETFWDAWQSESLGNEAELLEILDDLHAMQFRLDGQEPNDTDGDATDIGLDETYNLTFYGDNDLDVFRLQAEEGVTYRIATLGLFSGADTELSLGIEDASGVMLFNDDVSNAVGPTFGERNASEILWTAPHDGEFLLRLNHRRFNAAFTRWGSYSLRVEEVSEPQPIAAYPQVLHANSVQDVLIIGDDFADKVTLDFDLDGIEVESLRRRNRRLLEATVRVGDLPRGVADAILANGDADAVLPLAVIIAETDPTPILLTEVELGDFDAMELFNRGDEAVDLTGWALSVFREGSSESFIPLPDGLTLEPGSFLTLEEEDGADGNIVYLGESILWNNSDSGRCVLLGPDGRAVDMVQWGDSQRGAAPGTSWGLDTDVPPTNRTLSRIHPDRDSDSGMDWQVTLANLGTGPSVDTLPVLEFAAGGISSEEVALGGPLGLRLHDKDEDKSPFAEQLTVLVQNLDRADLEEVTLTETGLTMGIFESDMILANELSPTPNDGILGAQPGDLLAVRYVDPDDFFETATTWAVVVAGASPPPPSFLAGYALTDLDGAAGGTVTLVGFGAVPLEPLQVSFNGTDTGLRLDDAADGLDGAATLGIPLPNAPAAEILLSLEGGGLSWPSLVVE